MSEATRANLDEANMAVAPSSRLEAWIGAENGSYLELGLWCLPCQKVNGNNGKEEVEAK